MNQKYPADLIVKLYLEGNSTTEVARIVGCSSNTVSHICQREGINRSISEGKSLKWGKQPLSTKPRQLHSRARRLMERKLGRKLERSEEVHHRDNNLRNLSDDNLILLDTSLHAKITHWGKGTGVSWHKLANKWRARIVVDGKEHHLGLFVNEEEAIQVVIEYRKQFTVGLFGELIKEREALSGKDSQLHGTQASTK